MARNLKIVRTRIIAVIVLVFKAIAKKNTHERIGREFVSLNGGQKNEANTTKSENMAIRRRK